MLNRNIHTGVEQASRDCKPDYEGMINHYRDQLRKNENLQDALFAYIEDSHSTPPKLAEMIGDLVVEQRFLKKLIASTMSQQEKAAQS